MANHELKVGDVVRILKPKLYSGYEPYPERFIGMVGIVQRIAPDQQYPYYIASSDPTVMNIGFLRGELKWVKDYILPNPIEERIKKLYGKCKTTAHWAV
jgi:hypothetical protein